MIIGYNDATCTHKLQKMASKNSTEVAPPPPLPLFSEIPMTGPIHVPACVTEYVLNNAPDGAIDDLAYAGRFLQAKSYKATTLRTYRRDVERLLHWLWLVKRINLISVSGNDLSEFMKFSRSPYKSWIGIKVLPRFIKDENGEVAQNQNWRPYVASQEVAESEQTETGENYQYEGVYEAKKSTLNILIHSGSSLFTWLLDAEVIKKNPVKSMGKDRKRYRTSPSTKERSQRILSAEAWSSLYEYALSRANHDSTLINERNLFALTVFLLLGVRISEICHYNDRTPVMRDFYKRPDPSNTVVADEWWFKAHGKGEKIRSIPVPPELLTALRRFRSHLELPGLPTINDNFPLLPRQDYRKNKTGLSDRHLRKCFTDLAKLCAADLHYRGKTDLSQEILASTVHWLRHTSATLQLEFTSLQDLMENLGHTNLSTTQIYLGLDDKRRHKASQNMMLDLHKGTQKGIE